MSFWVHDVVVKCLQFMLGNCRGLTRLRTSYICFNHCYNICHMKTNFTYENLQGSYKIPACKYLKQNSLFKEGKQTRCSVQLPFLSTHVWGWQWQMRGDERIKSVYFAYTHHGIQSIERAFWTKCKKCHILSREY